MRVSFVSTERPEREFFAARFADSRVEFAEDLSEVAADAEVVSVFIYDAIDREFLDAHPALRLVVTRSTGWEHIDVALCRERGIAVAHVGDYGQNSVAEHTMALILAVARRLRACREVRELGRFSHLDLRGFDLRGRTLGLIGVGRIGVRVARFARCFSMNVVAYDPHPNAFYEELVNFRYASLDEVLAAADVISLHAPLTEYTRHVINAENLAKCRDGVVIINTARGGLIDTRALVAGLESGKVLGAGLDVLEDERVLRRAATEILSSQIADRVHRTEGIDVRLREPERMAEIETLVSENALLGRDDVVFTPHIAFNTDEAFETINETTARTIEDFLGGRPLKHATHG